MKFRLHIFSTVVCFLFLLTLSFGQGQAVITIASPAVTVYTNTVVVARDAIFVQPKTTFSVTAGNESRLYIDKNIQLPAAYDPGGVHTSNFNVPAIDYNLPVGTISGSGNVTSSGQASYTIPIALPPGTNGMAPSLGISYNSGSSDGLLGRGWNISGVSAIMRVPKDVYHDNVKAGVQLNSSDVYALDGIRIIGDRLEYDNFSKITPLPNAANPTSFKVETKDGLTMEYGNISVSPNSQLVLHVPTDVTFAWYLSKVYDKHNNYMLYDYYNANGEVAIKEIKYTGNVAANISPYNSVKFYYDIRTDKREQYLLGNRMQRTLILREMQIDCEGNFMKGYKFAYGYDDFYVQTFLNSITAQGSDFTKLNTTYIKYGTSSTLGLPASSASVFVDNTTQNELPAHADYRAGDFNGDGKSDLVGFDYSSIDPRNGVKTYSNMHLYINQGLNPANLFETKFHKTSSLNIQNQLPYTFTDFFSNSYASPLGLQVADFDGDGKDDLLLADNAAGSAGTTYFPYQSTGTGFNQVWNSLLVANDHSFSLADIDGDGKYEGVALEMSGTFYIFQIASNQNTTIIPPNNYSGLTPIDYDGDGRQNEFATSRQDKMAIFRINFSTNTISEIYIEDATPQAYSELFFGDFNGDGITDNVKVLGTSSDFVATSISPARARIRFGTGKDGTGNGYVKSDGTAADNYSDMEEIKFANAFYSQRKYLVADINNDRRSDLVSFEFSTDGQNPSMDSWAYLGGTSPSNVGNEPADNGGLSSLSSAPTWDYNNNLSFVASDNFNKPTNFGQTLGGILYTYESIANWVSEFLIGDFNGDSKHDVFLKQASPCNNPRSNIAACDGDRAIVYFDKGFNQQFSTDQYMTSVIDGFRNQSSFKYETLANSPSNAYIKGNNPQYPVIDFQQPLYIAVQSSVSNGIGGLNTTEYTCDKAHLHLQGKGFLGFNTMTITTTYNTSPVNKIQTINEYTLNPTFIEKAPSKTETYTFPASAFVKRAEEVYTPLLQATVGKAHFTVMDKTVTADILSGAITTVDPAYNLSTGNIRQSTTTISDIFSNDIETTFVSSPTGGDITYTQAGSWIANVPDEVMTTITRQEDNANPYPRTIKYTYNTATGNITQAIQDPGKTKRIQTDYSVYDANTGVLKEVTVSDPGAAAPTVKTINYSYDSRSRFITQTTNPLGQSSFATYDPKWGKPLTETGIDGLITKYNYDGYGRNISVTTPDNLTATTAYGWVQPGSLNTADYTATTFGSDIVSNALFSITSQRPGSPGSRTIYDIYSRELAADIDGLSNKIFSANKYDARGNIFKQCGAYENIANAIAPVITTNLYDDLNRIISSQNTSVNTTPTIPPTAFSYTFPIPKNGNTIVTTTIPASASTGAKTFKKTTDASGLLRTSEDILGAATKLTYTYYSNRQLKTTTLGTSDITNMIVYDEYGMQSSLSEANSGLTTYEFDAYGRLTKQTDANVAITDMQYDVLDRIIQKTVTSPIPPAPPPSDVYNYTYVTSGNGLNMLQSISVNRVQPNNENISSTYTYDNLNRIKKVDENINGPVFSTSFEYDQFSNIIKETYPSAFAVTHSYNANGYHTQINRGDNSNLIYHTDAMNALGQYTAYTLGNGKQTQKTYTDFGFPSSFTAAGVQNMTFNFDPQNGNLTSRGDVLKGLSETFSYDNSDRLLIGTGGSGVAANYFPNGNIRDKSDATTGTNSYVYGLVKINALTKINNPTINISQSTQNVTYTPFNKAKAITEDTYELNITYGPDDERSKTILKNNSVLQSARYFSGDYEETTDAITPANSNKIHYINCAAGLVAMFVIDNANPAGKMYYPYSDYLGSILTVTDDQGNIAAEQSFDAWGRKRKPSDWLQPLIPPAVPAWLYRGYTGHEQLDQFRLINMNGRMYDPLVGRMLSPDNNLQVPDYSQNHNRYSYALNNPLKFTDLSGNDIYTFDEEGGLKLVEAQEGRDQFNIQGKDGIRGIKKRHLSSAMRDIYNSTSSLLKSGEISGVSFNEQGFYATVQAQILSGNDVSSSSESTGADNYNYLVQPDPGDWRESQETWRTYGKGMQEFHDFMQDVIIEGVITAATWDVGGVAIGAWKLLGRGATKGVSVIGPRSTYREFAKKIGANFLNVTDEAWSLRKNVEFLQGVVKRGDDVIFSGIFNPNKVNPKSILAQEIRYLQKNGYSWTDDFSRLIKK